MNKILCDICGSPEAKNYKLIAAAELIVFSLDFCDECADKLVMDIRAQIQLTDIEPVMKEAT